MLKTKEILPIKKLDDQITSFKQRTEDDDGIKVGSNVTDAVSAALYFAVAKAINPEMPFEALFKNTAVREYRPGFDKIPKLMFTVLNGGKESGSKVKLRKFYIIFDVNLEDILTLNVTEAYLKLSQAVEKAIQSTKGGANAFKRQVDGSYYNAYDNINDCFKMLEDVINQAGINNDKKKYLKIGINADAQNWYVEETKKYEWDGPKNAMDSNQLMEFYDKMVHDHPLLEYIEDGFANVDIKTVKKYIIKKREQNKVIIGVNALF